MENAINLSYWSQETDKNWGRNDEDKEKRATGDAHQDPKGPLIASNYPVYRLVFYSLNPTD